MPLTQRTFPANEDMQDYPDVRHSESLWRRLFEWITGHHGEASSLRRSKQQFEALINASADWLWETDEQGRFTFVSDYVQTNLGYAPDEVVGKTPWDLMPAADAEKARFRYLEFAKSRQSFREFDNVSLHKDGSIRYIRTAGTPLLGRGNRLLGYRGMGRDITASKISEEQLRVSEERLRLVLDATSDGVWDWDMASGHIYRSPRYCEIAGYVPTKVTPDVAFFRRLVHPDDLPQAMHHIAAHLKRESPGIEFDMRIINREGAVRWAQIKGRAVTRNEAGAALRIVGTLADITAAKADEAFRTQQTTELARRNAELERFNIVTVGREMDMIALKQRVNELSALLHRPPPYPLAFLTSAEAPCSNSEDSAP